MKKQLALFLALTAIGSTFAQNITWVRGMGGSAVDVANAVTTDTAGNVYTTGNFQGTADFDPGPAVFNLSSQGSSDVFITKFDAQGNFVWAKSVGGLYSDYAIGIAADVAGNVVVTGSYSSTVDFDPGSGTYNLSSAGLTDCFALSLDAAGNFAWAGSIGGPGSDRGGAITVDSVGNVYIAGGYDTYADMNPGPVAYYLYAAGYIDVFICKLDNDGNFIWARSMGGQGGDTPFSISLDAAGNIYTGGIFASSNADFDPGPGTYYLSGGSFGNGFISKLDATGTFQWASGFLGGGSCYVNAVKPNATGEVYITGGYNGSIDFDPGSGTAISIVNGASDAYIAKLDASGGYLWSEFISSNQADQGMALAVENTGNIYVAGYFGGLADFDPGPAVLTLNNNGSSDLFITSYDPAGNYVSAYVAGSTGADDAYALTLDASGNPCVAGTYQNTVAFDTNNTLSSAGNADAFVMKLQSCSALVFNTQPVSYTVSVSLSAQFVATSTLQNVTYQWQMDAGTGFANLTNAGQFSGVTTPTLTINAVTLAQNAVKLRCIITSGNCSTISNNALLTVKNDVGIQELALQSAFIVAPNPAGKSVMIQAVVGSDLPYTISDQTGRLVLSGALSAGQASLDISHLAAGLYLVQVGNYKPVKLVKD